MSNHLHLHKKKLVPSIKYFLQGVRSPVVGALSSEHGNNMANKLELANNMANMTKSNLDNIVGSLWQARQESSGSSRGDQVIKKKNCGEPL